MVGQVIFLTKVLKQFNKKPLQQRIMNQLNICVEKNENQLYLTKINSVVINLSEKFQNLKLIENIIVTLGLVDLRTQKA